MGSVEYSATVSGVKRGLKAKRCSQKQAALATGNSPALVSMVLAKKARSQPCLDELARYLNALPDPERMNGNKNGAALRLRARLPLTTEA